MVTIINNDENIKYVFQPATSLLYFITFNEQNNKDNLI